MKRFTLFTLVFLVIKGAAALPPRPLAFTPGLSVGYVWGAGISFGADINYTPFRLPAGNSSTALGIYGTCTFFFANGEIYRDNWYRSLASGVSVFADDRFLFKAGVAKTVLRWGSNHVNKIKSKHLTPDLDISYDHYRNGFFAGYHFFSPGNGCFGLDIKTVNIFYASYRYRIDRTTGVNE